MSVDTKELKQILKKHGPLLGLIVLGIIAIIVVGSLFSIDPDTSAGSGIVSVFSQKRNSRSYIGDRSTMLYYPNKPVYRNKIKRDNLVLFDTETDAKQYGFIRSF